MAITSSSRTGQLGILRLTLDELDVKLVKT